MARVSRRRWLTVSLTVIGWLGVAAGGVGVVARTVPIPWQPVIVAAAASVYLALGAVVGGALLAGRRSRVGVALALAVVVWTVVVQVPLFVGATPRPGVPLVVLQANIRVGGVEADRLVDRVRTRDVDLLTVDELTPDALDRLTRAGLDQLLPHRLVTPYPGGAGTGIWSRLPLTDTVAHDEFTFELLTARVTVPGAGPVAVAAVHLLPPWPYDSSTWLAETRRLHDVLRDITPPGGAVVAAGDFNASLDNPQFRGLLRDGIHDAAERAGAGFHPTYPTDRVTPPLLTLDHVLLRGADPDTVRWVDLPGSDHRGLLVTVLLPRP